MSAFPYVFGLLMRALHTTEMLSLGAFPRASRLLRASHLPLAAPELHAGDPSVRSTLYRWDHIPVGDKHPQCFALCKAAEAQTPYISTGARYRGARLVCSAETLSSLKFTP